ncbi:MAG: UbiA family prenyltransferase [Verrucomicrobiales bacterium]
MPRLTLHQTLNNSRWWIYQRERFPIFAHGLLIAAFSASAVSFSALLRGGSPPPAIASYLTAFVTSFLLFLQLRIADEHKDFDEDRAHRPYRPVPRGLVTLRELAALAAAGAFAQLVLAAAVSWHLVGLLLLTWTYLALMTKEFFVRDWLVARPVTYLWTHMLIIPLADFYATACDWLRAGQAAPPGLFWFIAASFTNGVALEIGRKIRSPDGEEPGVRTYSSLWGPKTATTVWLAALAATAACALPAAQRIDFLAPATVVLGSFFVTAILIARAFVASPIMPRARRLDQFSALWTVALYLTLGIIPLLLRGIRWDG